LTHLVFSITGSAGYTTDHSRAHPRRQSGYWAPRACERVLGVTIIAITQSINQSEIQINVRDHSHLYLEVYCSAALSIVTYKDSMPHNEETRHLYGCQF